MNLEHFLVPTDFSETANQALDYAIDLASKVQARLTLIHILHPMPMGAGEMGVALPEAYMQDLETSAQQGLDEMLKRVSAAGLQGDSFILHGAPFQSIVDLARDEQVDLIVMSTHGRTGFQHVLMGSVAEKVVRLAPCPVLVTRGQAQA